MDGKQFAAKLQHPLAVAFSAADQFVYVADTYNHKVKRIDVATNMCESCHFSADASGCELAEPGGLCLSPNGDRLFIADTNNHRIEIVDLTTKRSTTMKLAFHSADSADKNDFGANLQSTRIRVRRSGAAARINVLVSCGGVKFTDQAPQKWSVSMPNEKWLIQQKGGPVVADQPIQLDIAVPAADDSVEQESVVMSLKLSLCSGDVCFPKLFSITFPVFYDGDDGLEAAVETTVRAIVTGTEVTLA